MTTALAGGRKATQRERLLAGMIVAGNRDGYARANVTNVIAEAGVSRPTFYDYFSGKDDCFLAALADVQRPLLVQIREGVENERGEDALHASLRALVAFATSQPARARFLTSEPMAGGPAVLDARDLGIAAAGSVAERAYRGLHPAAAVPDFCPRMLLGGAYRVTPQRNRTKWKRNLAVRHSLNQR